MEIESSEARGKIFQLPDGAFFRCDSDESLAFSRGSSYDPPMDNERIAKIETRLDGVERQLSEIKEGQRGLRNIIIGTAIGILAIIVPLVLHESNRNWEIAQKAFDRASEANVKVEAIRLAAEWQKQDAQKTDTATNIKKTYDIPAALIPEP